MNGIIFLAIAPGTYTDFNAHWEDSYGYGNGSHGNRSKESVTFEAGKIYDLGYTSEWTVQ